MLRNWFADNDWIEVNVPTLVKSAVEGGSTLFPVKYFKEEAFLSQSAIFRGSDFFIRSGLDDRPLI